MKFLHVGLAAAKLASVSLLLVAGAAQAADTKVEVAQAASAAAVKVAPKVAPGKVVPKVTTATGSIAGKGGENQYPSGTIPLPPKPKKEGLDAAAATKIKAVQP